jgi:hypothetical protein
MLRVLVGVLATRMTWTLGVVDCGTVVFAAGADAALAGVAALAVCGALACGTGAAEPLLEPAVGAPLEPPPPPQA